MTESRKQDRKKEIRICIILCMLGILYYVTRFFMTGIPHYKPEDTLFHINRLLGLGNVWTSPVSFDSFAGTGTYVNLFYPWLTMYPMWLFYKLCGSAVVAYKLYYMLLGIVTLLVSYRCMKKIVPDDAASFCFAVLYTFSSYRFANVFRRAALGESIAMTFLPIVLLGMYLIIAEANIRWRTLSIGIALIAYTHILSILLTGVAIVLLILVSFYWWDRKRERVIALFKAFVASVALSCGALIPFLQASLQNNVYHPAGNMKTLLNHTDSLGKILLNSIRNVPSAHGIGLLACIALAGAVLCLCKGLVRKERERKTSILLLVFGIVFTVAASSVMPWKLIGRVSVLRIIQFPWRLYAYATLFITASFSIALAFAKEKSKRIFTVVITILAILLIWTSVVRLHPNEHRRITEEYIEESRFPKIDYSPQVATDYREQEGNTLDKVLLDGEEIAAERSVSPNGGSYIVVLEEAKANQVLDIPVYWFSTVKVRVNNEEIDTVMSERGTVSLTLPRNGKVTAEVFHKYTGLMYGSWLFSLAILILLLITGSKYRSGSRRGFCL